MGAQPLAWQSQLVWIRADLRGSASYMMARRVLYHAASQCGPRFGRTRSFVGQSPYVQVTVSEAHERGVFACPTCAPDLHRNEAHLGMVTHEERRIRDRDLVRPIKMRGTQPTLGFASVGEAARNLASKGALRMIEGAPHCMRCPSEVVADGLVLRCPNGHFRYEVAGPT